MLSGLTYTESFISHNLSKKIIDYIDAQDWNTTLSRRTQHYGFEYNYKGTGLIETDEIPEVFKIDSLKKYNFNQVIVNEYTRNQGIGAHIDNEKFFGPVVASVSLLAPAEMIFDLQNVKKSLILQPASCVILEKEARYLWKHQIQKNVSFTIDGEKYVKPDDYRRISLTFRTTIN